MVMRWLTSFDLRPRRWIVALVPVLMMLTALGCNHRRSALRPVYVTPAPACATPGVVSEGVVPAPTTSTPTRSSTPDGDATFRPLRKALQAKAA